MIHNPPATKVPHEIPDLVDGNRVTDSHVDTAPLFDRNPPIDSNQPPVRVKQRTARVAWIDRGIGLDTVGIFQQRTGRVLVVDGAWGSCGWAASVTAIIGGGQTLTMESAPAPTSGGLEADYYQPMQAESVAAKVRGLCDE